MTVPGAGEEPVAGLNLGRRLCPAAAATLAVVVVLPPLFQLSRRYEFVQALQFSVFALVVPALVALGVPRARLFRPKPREPGPVSGASVLRAGGTGASAPSGDHP